MYNGFKKTRKGKLKKFEYNSNSLGFGLIGLKAIESGILNSKQIEASKQIINKITKHKSKIWVKGSLTVPIFSKPIGVRMGKGKGKFSNFAMRFKAGSIIFELSGANINLMVKSLVACKLRLPINSKICLK